MDGHWVFGGIKRGTTKTFMVVHTARNIHNFRQVASIEHFVHTGLHSPDGKSLTRLREPTTGAHTNTLEGYWSCVKGQLRRQGLMNTSSDLFSTYTCTCTRYLFY